MTVSARRAIMVGASLALAAAAVVSVMIAPERLQLVLFISSNGANQVVLSIGYWMAVAVWMVVATQVVAGPTRAVAARTFGVAVVLHVLLLLAVFSARLDEPAAFSARLYWLYARAFSGAALAASTWWAVGAVRALASGRADIRGGPDRQSKWSSELVDLPIVAGAMALAIACAQHDPLIAVGGLTLGAALAAAIRPGTPLLAALPHWIRNGITNERVFVVAVFVLALTLRLLYLRKVMTNPNYIETGADGPVYDELAWSIARGEGIRESFTNRFPLLLLGYVWFAGAVYTVVGHSYFILCALQSVIGALACVLLYAVSKELFDVVIARVATLFAAISFPLLFAAAAIGHQAIDVFLTVLLVWLLIRVTKATQPSWRTWAGIGSLFAAAIAIRETVAFFLVFALIWIPFAFRRLAWNGAFSAVTAVVLGAVVLLAPFALPKVATEERRLGLRVHFDRLFTGEADPNAIRTAIAGPLATPRAAVAQFRSDPRLVVGTLGRAYARNIGLQFFSQPYGGFDLVFLSKGSPYYYGLWSYTYVLAAAGMVAAFRAVRKGGAKAAGLALVLGVIIARTMPHVVLESNYRHRVPIEPFLILLTAAATVSLVSAARSQWEMPGGVA